jgi:hypothetical protein
MITKEQLEKYKELQDALFKRSCSEYNIRTSNLLMSASSAIGTLIREVERKEQNEYGNDKHMEDSSS